MKLKLAKRGAWVAGGAILALVVALSLGNALLSNSRGILAFSELSRHFSLNFLVLRLAFYALLYWQWPNWLRRFGVTVQPDLVPRFRIFVIELCVAYELAFGLNVFQWFR